MSSTPPSAWRIQEVLATWERARASLLQQDATLADDETALAQLLRTETADADNLIDRLVRAKRDADAMVEGLKAQMADMRARLQRHETLSSTCKVTAEQIMEVLGWPTLRRPDFTASRGVSARGVHITDVDAVPDAFCKIERTPRKLDIGKAIDEGQTVPGAERSNGTVFLRVTTR
jgi:hypothetical protein